MKHRSPRTLFALLCCATLSAPLYAGKWNVPLSARDLENPVSVNTATQAQGQKIYDAMCLECHGAKAEGDGTQERVEYDLRHMINYQKQADGSLITDGELYWKITHGIGKMPAYSGRLTDEERWLMVNHLRVLSQEYARQEANNRYTD